MRAPLLVASVVLQQCGTSAAYRIHTADEAAIYRLLGHPALGPLSNLAAQLQLLEAATPCLLRAAAEDPEAAECAQALRLRSRQLRPILKDVGFFFSLLLFIFKN